MPVNNLVGAKTCEHREDVSAMSLLPWMRVSDSCCRLNLNIGDIVHILHIRKIYDDIYLYER